MLGTLQNLIDDYRGAHPDARDPEVLMLFSLLLKKLGEVLAGSLTQIMDGLCESTLDMIKNDTISYPEFRQYFFKLI